MSNSDPYTISRQSLLSGPSLHPLQPSFCTQMPWGFAKALVAVQMHTITRDNFDAAPRAGRKAIISRLLLNFNFWKINQAVVIVRQPPRGFRDTNMTSQALVRCRPNTNPRTPPPPLQDWCKRPRLRHPKQTPPTTPLKIDTDRPLPPVGGGDGEQQPPRDTPPEGTPNPPRSAMPCPVWTALSDAGNLVIVWAIDPVT